MLAKPMICLKKQFMFIFCSLYFPTKLLKNLLTFEGKLDTVAMKELWGERWSKTGKFARAARKQMSLPKSVSVIFSGRES